MSYRSADAPLLLLQSVPAIPRHRRVLSENIRAHRKASGLSQEKLAEKADLHSTYLSDIERGAENISVDALARIATALRISLLDFCSGRTNGVVRSREGTSGEKVFLWPVVAILTGRFVD